MSHALATPADPMSIVEVNPSDKSVEYLRYIFGNSVNVILGEDGPNEVDSVLGAMSSILCAGMLLFTGLIIIFVLISGILDTANEGNPLGKTLSTMWVPLRMVLAMGLVLPLSGGYSTMQIGVLWVAGHGVGLANTVWNEALDHIDNKGSLYPPPTNMDFEQFAAGMLNSRTCMHAINYIDRNINIVESPYESITHPNVTRKGPSQVARASQLPPGLVVMQRYTNNLNHSEATAANKAIRDARDKTKGQVKSYKEANPCGSIGWNFAAIDGSTNFAQTKNTFQRELSSLLSDLDQAMDPIARSIVEHVNGTSVPPDPYAFLTAVEAYKNGYFSATQNAMAGLASARIDAWSNGTPENAQTTICLLYTSDAADE